MKKIISILGMMFLLAIGVFVCGVYISYHDPIVTKYEYPVDGLSESVKLVVLSDLHSGEYGENNTELISMVKEQEADAIFMVGDFLNRYDTEHAHVLELVKELDAIVPVYYALGNHEQRYMEAQGEQLLQDLTDMGAELLELSYQDIELNGQTLRLGGMLDYAFALDGRDSTNPETMKPQVYQYLCDFQDTDLPKIMLAHRPESFILGEASVTWDVDLVISGHVHGGQVVLPFVGGMYGSDQGVFPNYVYGLYHKDKIDVLISSGLGSGFTWIPRFNNPPEIISLTLVPD